MESASPEYIKKKIKVYIAVFVALAFLTVVTVAISYLHLSPLPAIGLALLVAAIKGTLVAGYFMHLFHEKKIIIYILMITMFMFTVCLLIPVLSR